MNKIALNTMEITGTPGQAPEWVKLIPAGLVIGRDGRAWNNSKPSSIVLNFQKLGRDLPVDIEHSSEIKAPKGEPAPAVGWVRELLVEAGEIWGRVEWNSEGKTQVEGRAYRYLSPVIVYEPSSGTIAGVISVGLTNQPNLRLPALNSQQAGTIPTNKEEKMDLKKILAALGLGETATEEDALAKIKELKGSVEKAANRAEAPSLEKFVPRADYDTALARATNAEQAINGLRKEQLETAINSAIAAALKAGKITPATVDYHRAQCRQEGGLALFEGFVAAAPVIGDNSGLGDKGHEDQAKALNAEQQQIAAMFGNSAEDIAKYGK